MVAAAIAAAQSRWQRIVLALALLIGLACVALGCLGVGHCTPLLFVAKPLRGDFALYYADAAVAVRFGWPHMYDLPPFVRVVHEMGIVNYDPPVTNLALPLLTWLVAPFALLPFQLAFWPWLALMAALSFGSVALVAPAGRLRLLAALSAAACLPAVLGIGLGQASCIVMGAVAVSAWLALHRRQWAAGLVLTLAVVKPQLVFLLPLTLLAAGYWRVVLGWVAGCALMTVAWFALLGPERVIAYVEKIGAVSQTSSQWQVGADISLAHLPVPYLSIVLQVLVAVLATRIAQLRRPDLGIAVAAGLLASLLAAPYLHFQDLSVLLVAGWLLMRSRPSSVAIAVALAVLVAANLAPFGTGLRFVVVLELAWLIALMRAPYVLRPASEKVFARALPEQ